MWLDDDGDSFPKIAKFLCMHRWERELLVKDPLDFVADVARQDQLMSDEDILHQGGANPGARDSGRYQHRRIDDYTHDDNPLVWLGD